LGENLMTYFIEVNGEWVEIQGLPDEGQKYKSVDNNGTTVESFYSVPRSPEPSTKITRLAFLNRFTDAEAIAIDLASIDNPSGTIQERQGQAALRRFLTKINSANYIDIRSQQTIDGLNALVGLGLLTTERASAILNDTIQAGERL
jgi:hypothetical protein